LSIIDEHFSTKWEALGPVWTRAKSRREGTPSMKLIRYADDFVVMIYGTRDDAQALYGEVAWRFRRFPDTRSGVFGHLKRGEIPVFV
jgi:hypothetical protein